MSPRRLTALAGLVVAASLAAPGAAAPAPAGFRAPSPVVRTLPNGLTVAVFQDDRLPFVQIQLMVRAGSAHEPPGEAGVASLTYQLLGQGTASRTAAVFDQAVQALGGSVGGNVSREFAMVNGAFLSGDMEAGLELLADAVVNPLFDEGRLMSTKDQLTDRLTGARQDPAALADDHLWGAVFRDHPYGRPPHGEPRALDALGVAEVRKFHRNHYRPDQALLAIAGNVTPERAVKAAEDLLGSWGGRAQASPAAGVPPRDPGWRVRIVDVPRLARAELRLGTLGPSRAEPDHDALTVAGELLASQPEGTLRVLVSGLRSAGLFSIASSVAPDSVGSEIARMRAALAGGLAAPPAADALDRVKRRLADGFALEFETRGGLIAQWMAATIYAGTGDRMGDYPDRIRALTGGAVHAALTRYVTPDRMVLIAVGPADRLRPQLEGLGQIEVVPAEAVTEVVELPSTARTPPTPEQVAKGRTLVNQAAAAHGGLERLRGIKDSTLEGDVVVTPGPREHIGKVRMVRKNPDRFVFSLTISGIESIQVLDGDRGWSQAGGDPTTIEDLDSMSVVGLRAGSRSDPGQLLISAADPGARVAWRGRERRYERDTDVLEVVSADGERRVLFIDADSHRLLAMEQNDRGHSTRRIYRDHRDVSGVLWPFNEERLLDGQKTMIVTWSRIAFNTGVKDAVFIRPGSSPAGRPAAPAMRPRPR